MTQQNKTKRLNKFISENSKYSRRKADELIKNGKVEINNKKVTELGTKINPEKDEIKIENKKIQIQNKKIYLALNKTKGFICTRNDEKGRKTIMDLVPKIENLKPIGRLDKDTEGLILISNDGDFINKVLHPKFKIKKTYLVTIKGTLKEKDRLKLENGIIIDGKKTLKSKVEILNTEKDSTKVKITIQEGRNRQIRKMFEKIHHPVTYLKRIQIHEIKLNDLKPKSFRNLTNKEIQCFQAY